MEQCAAPSQPAHRGISHMMAPSQAGPQIGGRQLQEGLERTFAVTSLDSRMANSEFFM